MTLHAHPHASWRDVYRLMDVSATADADDGRGERRTGA